MARRRLRAAAAAAVLAAALGLGACFAPREPGCAFSCAVDGLCPAEYTCRTDGLCHRIDGKGACTLGPVDAAAPPDGAPDATD